MNAVILIVDDEHLMTAMLSALLSAEGYEILQASDGVQACSVLAEHIPDVIVSDLAMPSMDGFELLRWVRENPRTQRVPFIVLTAYGEVENRNQAIQLGADDFLTKPFNNTELIRKVGNLVSRMAQATEDDQAGLSGDLAQVPLPDIFHILEMGRKTGRVHLSGATADGYVFFQNGNPVHAVSEGWMGEDAILRFLTWDDGHFEFNAQHATTERSITKNTHEMLVVGVDFLDQLENAWGTPVQNAAQGEQRQAILDRHGEELQAYERAVLDAVDGKRTLADVAKAAEVGRFAAFVALRTLASLGLLIGASTDEELDPLGTLLASAGEGFEDQTRALIIDGSAPFRQELVAAVNESSDLQVIGAVGKGDEALDLIRARDPAVVTLDLNLPNENGLRLLKRIMVQFPRPVVVVSALTQEGSTAAFECLRYGAVDFMSKPGINATDKRGQLATLVEKLRRAPDVQLRNIRRVRLHQPSSAAVVSGIGAGRLVVIGCGIGGVGALIRFIAGLPRGLGVAVLIIQHIPDTPQAPFVEYLQRFASLPIRAAEDGALLEPGVCYFATSDHYVNVQPGHNAGLAALQVGPRPEMFQSTQTINWAMFSVAEALAERAVAVILGGQTDDGSKGVAEIHRLGGCCIVQSPDTCIAPEMPQAAIDLDVVDTVVPDGHISDAVVQHLQASGA